MVGWLAGMAGPVCLHSPPASSFSVQPKKGTLRFHLNWLWLQDVNVEEKQTEGTGRDICMDIPGYEQV